MPTQVSFLIEPRVIPGRMTLLVTLLLVLINIFNTVSSNSPNVEGFTAISTWILSCILFVFAALVGYAGILFKIRYVRNVSLPNAGIYCIINGRIQSKEIFQRIY